MFRMTADIKVEGFKPFKPSSLKWDRHVDNFSDSAQVTIPGMCRLVQKDKSYAVVPSGLAFTEGMKISIACGYDGRNVERFRGFIKRINFSVPVQIDCEGYAYQLRKVIVNQCFVNTTVRNILHHITQDTDIKLSEAIPEIPIPKVWFKNYTGIQVLEYLKEKCLLTVYFNFDTLYAGLRAGELKGTVKHRLNWNVIKDNELLFNADKEFANVNIVVDARNQDGTRNRQKAAQVKAGNEKQVKLHLINDPVWRQKIAEDVKNELNNKGYSGTITGFLVPAVEPGMTSSIIDKKYEERNGSYFVEGVQGSFGMQGGRQKVKIGFSL